MQIRRCLIFQNMNLELMLDNNGNNVTPSAHDDGSYPFEDWHEPLDKLCMQSDWVHYTLNMLGIGGSLGAFKYSTAGVHLLSAVITRAGKVPARLLTNTCLNRSA